MAETTHPAAEQSMDQDQRAWVSNILAQSQDQDQDIDDEEDEESTPPQQASDTEPEAPKSSWKDALIPEDDDEVDRRFRGKPTAELYNSYRNLESEFTKRSQALSRLEAENAALKAIRELLPQATQQPSTPQAPEFDFESDPIVKPGEFFPKYEKRLLSEVSKIIEEKVGATETKIKAESQQEAAARNTAIAMETARQSLGLSVEDFGPKAEYLLFQAYKTGNTTDPNLYTEIYERTYGKPRPATPPPSIERDTTNPPGAKRPTPANVAPKNVPVLRDEERQIAEHLAALMESNGVPINRERFFENTARNLKEARRDKKYR